MELGQSVLFCSKSLFSRGFLMHIRVREVCEMSYRSNTAMHIHALKEVSFYTIL